MKGLAALLLLVLAGPAGAGHPWAGVDLCVTRADALGPSVDPARLPDPASPGARLMGRYCSQCHHLPHPARHSRDEWPAVLARMASLTGVSGFYRGALGPAAMPAAAEWTALGDYLARHAPRRLPFTVPALEPAWGRLLSLAAFFGLAALGLWRWRRGRG